MPHILAQLVCCQNGHWCNRFILCQGTPDTKTCQKVRNGPLRRFDHFKRFFEFFLNTFPLLNRGFNLLIAFARCRGRRRQRSRDQHALNKWVTPCSTSWFLSNRLLDSQSEPRINFNLISAWIVLLAYWFQLESRAILLFCQIQDKHNTVLDKESWTNFMDGVRTMTPTPDILYQYLEGNCWSAGIRPSGIYFKRLKSEFKTRADRDSQGVRSADLLHRVSQQRPGHHRPTSMANSTTGLLVLGIQTCTIRLPRSCASPMHGNMCRTVRRTQRCFCSNFLFIAFG